MKIQKFNKSAALLVAFALTLSMTPAKPLQVKASDSTPKVIYSNDFEDASKLPDGKTSADLVSNISGSKAVKYNYKFNSTSDWDDTGKEIDISYDYTGHINSGAKLQFDIILPAGSTYTGTIKAQGVTKIGSGWTWTQSNTIPEIAASDFTESNGYLKKTVEIPFGSEIAAENDLHQIIIKLAGYQCSYSGDLYIDNVNLVDGTAATASNGPTTVFSNDFEDTANLPVGKTSTDVVGGVNGSRAVKYGVKFTGSSWEVPATITLNAAYTGKLTSDAKLQADLLIPAGKTYANLIKVQAGLDDTMASTIPEFKADELTQTSDGKYLIKTVEIPLSDAELTAKTGFTKVVLNIAGWSCDYVGDLLVDNVKIVEGSSSTDSKYVLKTVDANAQTKVDPSSLSIPSSVSLVDAKASAKTANLYGYLSGVGKSDYVIFGHENDTHKKAGSNKLTNSDTKDMTGSYSGVVGIDALSLTGAEYSVPAGSNDDLITATAKLAEEASSEGSIISLSAHMPNFAEVVKKGKDKNGKYDYSGYTPNVTSGNVVQRVMPGGDLNEAFTGYLDMLADFGNQLDAKGVPVLFRPFHENTGSWFWWGAAECDQASFKNLWRYTVEYMRDVKGVHNFLYVYSPSSTFNSEADYLDRYPGDDYVDVVAFDMYNNDPTTTDNFQNNLADTVKIVDKFAANHNKISAVSETGMIVSGSNGMAVTGNKHLDWFEDVLNAIKGTNAAYFLTWADFGETSGFFEPYMTDKTHGHEMINNFINFYNDKNSVFADGIGDFSKLSVKNTKSVTNTTGYIVTPYSGYRMLEANTLKATVKNTDKEVDFVLKDSDGNKLTTLKATGNGSDYTASITDELLSAIAPTYGSIELTIGGQVYDSIKIMFNMKEEAANPAVVDNFESYFGNDALMGLQWSTNAGTGCSVTPKTTKNADEHNKGIYGLAFNYKISTEKTSEGWAGVTKSLTADWSTYDALQLWVKPDGNGQKLVIQLTSNGEDFEVYLPELAATKEAKLLTIPFSQFVGKNKGTFDPTKITKMGIWCNTIVPKDHTGAWTVNSTMYFDDIKAVNTKIASISAIDNITAAVEQGQSYTLPSKVSATYSDGTKKDVVVTWTPSTVDTTKAGTYTFKGTVADYEGDVALTLNVTAKSTNGTGGNGTGSTGSSTTGSTGNTTSGNTGSTSTGTTTGNTSSSTTSTTNNSSVVKADNNSSDIVSKINDANITSVTIDATSNSVISKDVFNSLKGKDKNITIVGNGATWTFNGKDITNTTSSDINLSLKTVSEELHNKEAAKIKSILGKDTTVSSFSFNYDGYLPGTAKVTLSLGSSFANKTLSIYRYFADKNTYESITDVTADANGYITISLNHCSDYFAVEKSAAASLPKTGSFVDASLLLEAGALTIAFGAFTIVLPRRKKKRTE